MNPGPSSRRSFLNASGLAGAAVAIGEVPWRWLVAAEMSRAAAPTRSWIDKPIRWAQLTLVEDYPGKLGPRNCGHTAAAWMKWQESIVR